ncbi:MAG: lipopolysaccharide biosynthesis protein, partial [Bacteroides sp.]|nr:lipopolysaccharide biosynthesis protein [Bacteroides sp.]
IFYVIIYISAPAISRFFNEPSLISITRVMGGILVINALSIIQRTLLIKKIDFKVQTKISVIVSLSSGIVGIGMALLGLGVWSLVGQQISRQFLNSAFLWRYSSWRPSWIFSKKSFKELFGFGSKIMLSGLITTVHKHIYYLIIGRFYSAAQLGQYTRAEQFNSIFSSNLTNVVQRVSFPVLSSIQDEPQRLKIAYRKVIRTTMLVTFICMLGLAAVARPLVLILIGEKWLESVYYLQIICFSGMLYPLHALNLNILQVKGRSDLYLKLEIIKKVLALIPIFWGIKYGIEYMLWGSVVVSLFAYFLNSYYSARLIDYSTAQQVKDILPAFLISSFIAICMWGLSFFDHPNLLLLILQLIVGFVLMIVIYE